MRAKKERKKERKMAINGKKYVQRRRPVFMVTQK